MDREDNTFDYGEIVSARIKISSEREIKDAKIRIGYYDIYDRKIASSICFDAGDIKIGENELLVKINIKGLVAGNYRGEMILFETNDFGSVNEIDIIPEAFFFDVVEGSSLNWNAMRWGSIRMEDIKRVDKSDAE